VANLIPGESSFLYPKETYLIVEDKNKCGLKVKVKQYGLGNSLICEYLESRENGIPIISNKIVNLNDYKVLENLGLNSHF